MSQLANESRLHLGFLRIAQTDQGYVGGLLVTNHLGRPLEFQCTTPVRPNRTQEILYGPTLQPFIYAELIGKTLYERVSIKPQMIVVQQDNLLELRRQIDLPIACVLEGGSSMDHAIQLGRQSLARHAEYPEDVERIAAIHARIPNDADIAEPLERVRDALQETLRSNAVA